MSALQTRIAAIVPQLPPDSVVEAFQAGATIQEIIHLGGLSGPALAKAKLRLGSLRQEALRGSKGRDESTLREILQELEWVRCRDVLQQTVTEQFRFSDLLAASSEDLAALCLTQQDGAKRLEAINERILRARTSSVISGNSTATLFKDHEKRVADLRANFLRMRKVASHKLHICEQGTKHHERLLFLGGCSINDIVEAGGTVRTSRTTRNRVQRLIPLLQGQLDDELISGFRSALRNIAITEANLVTLDRTIKRDLVILEGEPGATSLADSIRQDRLTPGAWSNSFWIYCRDAVRRAADAMGSPPPSLDSARVADPGPRD
jgi:hypothetical protein